MKLPDNVYTVLKYLLSVCVAPTIALITGLGELYGWETTTITQTISLVATFLGAVFAISCNIYNKNDKEG